MICPGVKISMEDTKQKLNLVAERVQNDISIIAKRGGMYTRGLASEGYNGGYRDALYDVILALNNCPPDKRWRNGIT